MNLAEPSRPQIFPFESSFQKAVVKLAREILCGELGLRDDLDVEDLKDIAKSYAPPDNRFLMAVVDGRVAAVGGVLSISEIDCELRRIFVRADHRRQGLASSIMAKLVPFINERGYKRILMEIRPDMAPYSHLYERYGFKEVTDTLPRPGRFMSINL